MNHAGPAATLPPAVPLPPTVPLLPPPAAPRGWRVAPPDFVGVGAQRSGTTWWWGLLAEHPRFASVPMRNKELHFFDRYMGVRDIDPDTYYQYFPRPPGSICGEWTPRYMCDFWVLPMLARIAPGAKLLVLLRDPVARYLSGLSLVTGRGYPLTPMLLTEHLKRSLYAHQLSMLFRNFPRDQVLVLQYEACIADPVPHLRQTFEFLGLDPAEWQGESSVQRRVSLSNAAKPSLDTATHEALLDSLHADLCTLFGLLPSLDPGLWPSAAPGPGRSVTTPSSKVRGS